MLFVVDFIEKLKKVVRPPKTQLILRTLSADNMYLSQSFKFQISLKSKLKFHRFISQNNKFIIEINPIILFSI